MKQRTNRHHTPTGAAPRLAAGLRLILLGGVALLLLATTALGQTTGRSPASSSPAPEKSLQPAMTIAPDHDKSQATQGQAPAPDLEAAVAGKARRIAFAQAPGRPPCPLPPASVYTMTSELRKYLDTRPTPGSGHTEAWPEYVAEGDDDLE
jgi:hypothetical protein